MTAHSLCFPLWLLLLSPQEGEEQAGKPGIHHLSALPVGEGLKGQESREGALLASEPVQGREERLSWLGSQGKISFLFSLARCVLADLLY